MATISGQGHPSRPRISRGKVLLSIGLVLVLTGIGLALYLVTALPTRTMPIATKKITPLQVTPAPQDDQVEVTAVGKQYMEALLGKNYGAMWSMLHPQMQAIWPSEAAFTSYWKTRFQGYTLQGFSLRSVNRYSTWTNAETMTSYNGVDVMPISLQLQSQMLTPQLAKLAPQFQHPNQLFQNVPFVVQRTNDAGKGNENPWLVLNGGPGDLEAPILPPVTPVHKTVAVPILMYHHISDIPTTNILDRSLTVTPALFTQELDYAKSMGYHSITLNQLMDALYYGGPLPKKPIIFTFDDGYDDAYKFAYPILKAHSFSGMFYIITGKVGWRGQASWDQLKEMMANGMQMGSHTIHHVDMGSTYLFSPMQAQQEAQISQMDMQNHLGIPIQHFCYPNGGPFKGHNLLLQQEVVALLARNGYVDATTDPGPTGVIQSSLTPLALLRIRVDGREPLQQYISSLPF